MKRNFPALLALGLSLGFSGFCSGARFGAANQPEALFCEMQDIQGTFNPQEYVYTSRGACNMLKAQSQPAGRPGESKFTDFNNATSLYRINWTAKGGYNPKTKATWEEVIVPAPRVDEPSPPGRPYGRFKFESTCDKDPWLEFSARCSQARTVATGNLGADVQRTLAFTGRPFTSEIKPPQRAALDKQHRDLAFKGGVLPGSGSGEGFIQMFPNKSSAGTTPAPAPSAPQQTATAKSAVDVYNGPGGQYKVIGIMRAGQTAPVYQRHQDGWYELGLPGVRGWVAEDHLTVKP